MSYAEYLVYVVAANEPAKMMPWWAVLATGAVYAVAAGLFVFAAWWLAMTIYATIKDGQPLPERRERILRAWEIR